MAFCSFVSEQTREAELSGATLSMWDMLVRAGGVYFLLKCCSVGGGSQLQEHLAPVWGALFPLCKQIQLAWMDWWLLSCFSSPGAAKNLSGVCWDRSRRPLCQCAARAETATGATSFPLCLETKPEMKPQELEPGDCGCWSVVFVCIFQGYSSTMGIVLGKGAAQDSVNGEGLVLIFGAVSCLKSRLKAWEANVWLYYLAHNKEENENKRENAPSFVGQWAAVCI